jgi:hypothetical protein
VGDLDIAGGILLKCILIKLGVRLGSSCGLLIRW